MAVKIGVVGATGAVGTEFLQLLEERRFPLAELTPPGFSPFRGKEAAVHGQDLKVEELTHDSFRGLDLVLSSAGGKISKEFIPSAVKAGAVIVDNTSYFRMFPDVPLVVPEINPEDIQKHNGIIANPNCSTIIMVLPLWPLHKKFKIRRVVAATYQASQRRGRHRHAGIAGGNPTPSSKAVPSSARSSRTLTPSTSSRTTPP